MLHEKVWRNYNVSTLLILPIFNKFLKHITYNTDKYNIYSLFFDYGLINSYLYDSEDDISDIPSTLKVVFKADELGKQILNDNNYYNLLDMIDPKLINQTLRYEKYMILYLNIPEEHKGDIHHIVRSNYSQVSREYKASVDIAGNKIVTPKSELNKYLVNNNFSLRILIKSDKMKASIEEIFKTTLGDDQDYEYFCLFNKDKEVLNETNLNGCYN